MHLWVRMTALLGISTVGRRTGQPRVSISEFLPPLPRFGEDSDPATYLSRLSSLPFDLLGFGTLACSMLPMVHVSSHISCLISC
jgi:hypothetical protein